MFRQAIAVIALSAPAAFSQVTFQGMCDASGAAPVDGHLLIVNDEDEKKTLLRLFDLKRPGAAVSAAELPVATLQFDPSEAEIDLEAITKSGSTYWMIGSHSRSRTGKVRRSRQNLIAFEWAANKPVDVRSISGLLPALLKRAAELDKTLNLDPAVDPKDGGISIEGLAAAADGDLLIGFRSPLSQGSALMARLSKPFDVLKDGNVLDRLRLETITLGGAGVRDILRRRDGFLILSGPVGPGGPFAVWKWNGSAAPVKIKDVSGLITQGAPEGLVESADGELWLIGDAGATTFGGVECKKLPESKQSFQAVPLRLP